MILTDLRIHNIVKNHIEFLYITVNILIPSIFLFTRTSIELLKSNIKICFKKSSDSYIKSQSIYL